MKRQKTYLSPEQQYTATIAYYCQVGLQQEAKRYGRWCAAEDPSLGRCPRLAIIQQPHRLFVPGDLVVWSINNGCADRYPVWSVSSKGFKIGNYYMVFQRNWWREFQEPNLKSTLSGLFKTIWRPGEWGSGEPAWRPEDKGCFKKLDHPDAQSYLRNLIVRETLPHK